VPRRVALLAATVLALVIGGASEASAHATVTSTSPANGAVVQTSPTAVTVVFDEPVEAGFGSLRVFAPDGTRADVGDASHPAGHPDAITVPVRTQAHGTYTVAWRVVSADSHPVSGGFTFSVGVQTAAAAIPPAPTGSRVVGVLFGVARWTAYAGFAGLVGGAWFVLVCWRAGAARRRMRRGLAASWGLLTGGSVGALLLQGPYVAATGLGDALSPHIVGVTAGTRLGETLLVRLALLVLMVPVLWRLQRAGLVAGALFGLLSLGMAMTWAASDHAGVGMQVPLAMAAETLHVTAMAAWFGGLAAVAGVLLPAVSGREAERAVRRFSTVAFTSVVVLVITGTYSTWRAVGTLPALSATAYGRILLGKIAGFTVLVGLGALARRRIARRRLASLHSSVAVELAVGVSVLALTAVLVEAEPGRTAYEPPIATAAAFDTGGPNGRGTVGLTMDAGRVGYNTIHLDVLDAGGGSRSGSRSSTRPFC
jgi:copper transport protein